MGNLGRDNFLSRLFGLFSEEIVREYAAVPQARYENLRRPTLFPGDLPGWHTLDFTLRDRAISRTYVCEMKSELAFENYRYLRFTDPRQLDHHAGVAFQKFLASARDPRAYEVRIAGHPIPVDGAILVWEAVRSEGRQTTMAEYGFADVLSVESMIHDCDDGDGRRGERDLTRSSHGHWGSLRACAN